MPLTRASMSGSRLKSVSVSESAPIVSDSVLRLTGMPALLVVAAAGLSGYAALLPVAPLWAVHGGASAAGSGLVNGMLLLATILTQGFVPGFLRWFGAGRVLAVGLVLLGGPPMFHLLSDQLGWILALSAVRGIGFGIITVTGFTIVANLVPPARHGAAIGAYGAAMAIPQFLLLPAGPWLVETIGFWIVFALAGLPLLGIAAVASLAHVLHEQEYERSEPTGGEARSTEDVKTIVAGSQRSRTIGGLLIPMILLLAVTLAGGGLITFAPQMSSVPAATVGGLALLTATAAFSRWRIGALADRHGTRPFVGPLVTLTAGGLALAAFAVKDPIATEVLPLMVAMVCVGIAYGGLQSLTLLRALGSVDREEYGTASAVWNIGFDAGTGLGSILVGWLAAGFSFSSALLVAAGISLLTLPLAIVRSHLPGQSQTLVE